MRGRAALLASLTLVWAAHRVQSLQFERHRALRIVGGSIEDPQQELTGHSSVSDTAEAAAAADSSAAFVRPAVNDARTTKVGDGAVKDRLAKMKRRRPSLNIGLNSDAMEKLKTQSSRVFTSFGPAAMSFCQLFYHQTNGMLTKPAVYALALVGSSFGFHLFLYFITIGYAFGVTLPVSVAMILYNFKAQGKIPILTNIQSGFLAIWGIHSAWFFWYREYVNWPQLHEKVIEVDKLARTPSKIFCWLVYSIFYATMSTPFLCRLEAGMKGGGAWGRFGCIAMGLQAYGLLLEAVADHQKMVFKSQPGNRNQWCNVGLWKYSTHPNYLGEQLFWLGAFLGGLSCYRTPLEWTMAILGILFITVVLRGARASLGSKHRRKYGNNVEFLKFRQTHSMWGPLPWRKAQDLQLSL